ncbi:N-acetylglucosamine repressor [bacterium HR11]|nr:N-acetylglucosamine repressor [bacterium HR11]
MWLGIAIGPTFLKVGVVENDRLVYREVFPLEGRDLTGFLDEVDAVYQRVLTQFPAQGLGVALQAILSYPEGVVQHAPQLAFLQGEPLKFHLERRWSRSVVVASEAQMAAYGEYRLHPEVQRSQARHLVYLAVENGLSGGVVVDGRPYWGAHGWAGTIGHIPIQPDGPECTCGRRGCLEAFVTPQGILQRLQSVLWRHPQSRLRQIRLANLRVEDVLEAARFGDPAAQEVIEEAAQVLSLGVHMVASLLDPDVIVVGGSIVGSNDFFVEMVSQRAHAYGPAESSSTPLILPSHLKYFASVWGAALAAEMAQTAGRSSRPSRRKKSP